MIDIVITSFREPKTIGRAIEGFLKQELREEFEIYVVAPDKETLDVARRYANSDKRVKIFVDPGKGKSYALNQFLPKLKGRVIVLSDGDVFVEEKDNVQKILDKFENAKVGCVSGRPVSTEAKDTMFGYWSHLLCDAGAHEARLKRAKKGEFVECSGYLWAFRNKVINKFPLNVAEDTVVPLLFWNKGYKIAYSPESKVYVHFPKNLKEFVEQKKRTAKAHEAMNELFSKMNVKKTKSFKNEVLEGYRALLYPRNFREIVYTLVLFPVRLYIWMLAFYQVYVSKEQYHDAWKRVESTKR